MPGGDPYPINLTGIQYSEIESIAVHEWTPLPDGQGSPEEVHLAVQLVGWEHPLVLRFKDPQPIDSLVVALITHRNRVWSKAEQLLPVACPDS